MTPRQGSTRKRQRVVQDVSTKRRRGAFTHIAMICDDPSIQPRLPQILLGNERIFPKSMVERLSGELAANILLWRRKSGWVTKPLMREVLAQLLRSLGELTATHQVILLLDTAPVHICRKFLAAAARRGVVVQYVPAKLTWLLQPLDTHAFARYKRFLSESYRRHLLESSGGHSDVEQIIRLVAKTCLMVLQGVAWAYAFDGNGFGARQANVRPTVLAHVSWRCCPELTARLPTYDEVESIFPRRVEIPLREMLLPFAQRESCEATHTLTTEVTAARERSSQPAKSLWHGRLRSSSKVVTTTPGEDVPDDPGAASSTTTTSVSLTPTAKASPPPSVSSSMRDKVPVGKPLFRRRTTEKLE